jgi:hypothetical protein
MPGDSVHAEGFAICSRIAARCEHAATVALFGEDEYLLPDRGDGVA